MPRPSGGDCRSKRALQKSQLQQTRQLALLALGRMFVYGKEIVVEFYINQVELSDPKRRLNQLDQVLGDRLLPARTLAIHLAWEVVSAISTVSSMGFHYNSGCSLLTIASTDASVTQSALEEALMSNMQHGGMASRMSTISQALRSRYL